MKDLILTRCTTIPTEGKPEKRSMSGHARRLATQKLKPSAVPPEASNSSSNFRLLHQKLRPLRSTSEAPQSLCTEWPKRGQETRSRSPRARKFLFRLCASPLEPSLCAFASNTITNVQRIAIDGRSECPRKCKSINSTVKFGRESASPTGFQQGLLALFSRL